MRIRTLGWLVLCLVVLSLGLRVHAEFRADDANTVAREQAIYERTRGLIQRNYVREIDERKLFFGALEGMAGSLDRHSRFFPPDQYESFKVDTTGQLHGVGIEIDLDDERGLVVVTPLQDTPAWRGGVLPGDRILAIDGVATKGLTKEACVRMIKGVPNTPVRLMLLHEGDREPVEITLFRDVIEIKSVAIAEILGRDYVAEGGARLGYVQIAQFQEKTGPDLEQALIRLEGQGMQGLLLDLRQNPGGLLEAARAVADLFLENGLIVQVLSRDSEPEEKFARAEGTRPNYPVVILVDSRSASAAEIVAGALKDHGRATLVGDRTYGKFSVQSIIEVPMPEAWGTGALKVTVAAYKTPVGPCVDGQGIEPHVLVPSTLEQQRALVLDRQRRHLQINNPRRQEPIMTAPAGPDGTPRFDDAQLRKAIEVLAGLLAPSRS